MSLHNSQISDELQKVIIEDIKSNWHNPYRFNDDSSVRRDNSRDISNLWRPAFVHDIEKILYLPVYNRYSDKTQVFSLYSNDDISRRSLHVQLVSRISRNIGRILGLNNDLIEAIALGHDLGHAPFGHIGEKYLDELSFNEFGRHFNHNVHGVRILEKIFNRNITLQTLDGILCHNGELEMKKYTPVEGLDFNLFDKKIEDCYINGEDACRRLIPSTLEGCVVRISDIIAYLGKDRQDAKTVKIIDDSCKFSNYGIGTENAAMINNLVVDIIQNSYRKNYISLSDSTYKAFQIAKKENYMYIYNNERISEYANEVIKPMFIKIYYYMLDELKKGNCDSLIYKHHIDYINNSNAYYGKSDYSKERMEQIVIDYIASMTDDYIISLYNHIFPEESRKIEYISYFN